MKRLGELLCKVFHHKRSMCNWAGYFCGICYKRRPAGWRLTTEENAAYVSKHAAVGR